MLDSKGLELFGQGGWDAETHGRARRQWRKLHGDGFAVLPPADRFAMAVDAETGEIAAHVLTDGHADDAAQVPALLGQAEGVIALYDRGRRLRRRAYVGGGRGCTAAPSTAERRRPAPGAGGAKLG